MRIELARTDIASLLRPLSKADIFARPASAVQAGARRLEAGFYGSEGYRALRAMGDSGFEIGRFRDVARVRWFGPFSRVYVDDSEAGVPFLGSAEMLSAKLEPRNYISKTLTPKLERLLVGTGTILVSCSGTIGNVAMCTEDYSDVAVSQHAIRVDPTEDLDRGLLYVFLLSNLGQFLVTRNKSGSVIESIYAADVEDLPVPRLPKRLRQNISEAIGKAAAFRVRANRLLVDAEAAVQVASARFKANDGEKTPLPRGSRSNGVDMPPTLNEIASRSFIQSASAVRAARDHEGYGRLDATYYEPRVLALRARVREAGGRTLVQDVPGVTLIGKTFVEGVHKVEREYGVPYFTGKELFTIRPIPETFITSQRRALIDKLLVQRGTTLVTCAGTVGKVMYVRGSLEGSAVTHDAIRVLPGSSIHPGYVYAYLASPNGQAELKRCSYGSVIPRLYRTHVENIIIPKSHDDGAEVGQLVDQAFDMRQAALEAENNCIELFLRSLREGRSATESEWGTEH